MALTIESLVEAIRLGPSQAERNIALRLMGVSIDRVERYAPKAPQSTKDESVIRMSGYLYDAPQVASRQNYASAFFNSGAASLLSPWHVPQASSVSRGERVETVSVVNVTVEGTTVTIEYSDGSSRTYNLPTGEATPSYPMRVGWSADSTFSEAEFTEIGTTPRVAIPIRSGNDYLYLGFWLSSAAGTPSGIQVSGLLGAYSSFTENDPVSLTISGTPGQYWRTARPIGPEVGGGDISITL